MVTTKEHTAHKIAMLVKKYPEKTMDEILGLVHLPALALNTATWSAIDNGILKLVEEEGKPRRLELVKEPDAWDFGPALAQLEDELVYAFRKLAETEKDLEEIYYGNWLAGFAPHDIIVATSHLLYTNRLAEYHLQDGENDYLFYCLPENMGKEWGRKWFKKDPQPVDPNDAPIVPEQPEGEPVASEEAPQAPVEQTAENAEAPNPPTTEPTNTPVEEETTNE